MGGGGEGAIMLMLLGFVFVDIWLIKYFIIILLDF